MSTLWYIWQGKKYIATFVTFDLLLLADTRAMYGYLQGKNDNDYYVL